MAEPLPRPPLQAGQIGVLIVEDDTLLREDTCTVLAGAGLITFPAADADEAVALLDSRSDIQVMITDVILLGGAMDGWQLVRLVSARWPRIGQLVVSGSECPKLGNLPFGVRFLPKPYRPHDLVSQVFGFVAAQTGGFC